MNQSMNSNLNEYLRNMMHALLSKFQSHKGL